jgi:hypothetical protein
MLLHLLLLFISNLLIAKGRRGGMSLQHLYAMVAAVAHYDAPLAVNHNAVGMIELPISTTFTADGSNATAIGIP